MSDTVSSYKMAAGGGRRLNSLIGIHSLVVFFKKNQDCRILLKSRNILFYNL
jgi:hypothetical protein